MFLKYKHLIVLSVPSLKLNKSFISKLNTIFSISSGLTSKHCKLQKQHFS